MKSKFHFSFRFNYWISCFHQNLFQIWQSFDFFLIKRSWQVSFFFTESHLSQFLLPSLCDHHSLFPSDFLPSVRTLWQHLWVRWRRPELLLQFSSVPLDRNYYMIRQKNKNELLKWKILIITFAKLFVSTWPSIAAVSSNMSFSTFSNLNFDIKYRIILLEFLNEN